MFATSNPTTRREPVAKNAEALKRTDEATPQKAIVIGLSPKLAPEKRASAKKGRGKTSRRSADFVVNMAPSDVRSTIASCCGAQLRHLPHDWRCRTTGGFHPVASDAPSTSSRLRASAKLVSIS